MSLAKSIRRNTIEHAALTAYIEERLTKYRSQLESADHPLDKVPGLRARIAELRSLQQSINEESPDE